MRRNSPRVLLIQTITAARGYLPLLLLFWATERVVDGWLHVLVVVLFWVITVSRIHAIGYSWLGLRYRTTDRGLHVCTGLLVTRDLELEWSEMTSVQVSRSLLHQLTNTARVRIGLGSKEKREIVLECVDLATAALFNSSVHQVPVAAATDNSAPENDVYTVRRSDYLLISLTYGQFLLFVPITVNAYREMADVLPLPRLDLPSLVSGSMSGQLAGLVVAGAIVASLAYGYVVAWLRYRAFSVRLERGVLTIRNGLLSREIRHIDADRINGLKLQQNPVMRLFGYGKLSYISRESGERHRANVTFPVMKVAEMSRWIDSLFPSHRGMLEFRGHRRWGMALVLGAVNSAAFAAAATGLCVIGVAAPQLPLVAIALVQLGFTNRAWSSVYWDRTNDRLSFRRGFLWVRHYSLPIAAIHLTAERQGPFGRWLGLGHQVLFAYDDGRIRLRLNAYDWSRITDLRRGVTHRVGAGRADPGSANSLDGISGAADSDARWSRPAVVGKPGRDVIAATERGVPDRSGV